MVPAPTIVTVYVTPNTVQVAALTCDTWNAAIAITTVMMVIKRRECDDIRRSYPVFF
jgi:hypothetical protein